jgi:hypothetical protein
MMASMLSMLEWTPRGEALTDIILTVFRLYGDLLAGATASQESSDNHAQGGRC